MNPSQLSGLVWLKRRLGLHEEAERKYWGLLLPLFLLTLFSWIDHMITVPLSAEISAATGLSPVRSGLLVSVYPAAAAVSAFIFAPWSDRLGRKQLLLYLGSGFVISTFGCALAQGVEGFFLFRVLSGAFAGLIMPNCLAYAGDALQGNRRNRALTNIMLGFTLASILGVPVGSALAEWVSWRWTFGVIGLGGLLSLLWLTSIPSIATGAEQITIRRQYLQMFGLWKRQEVRWVFAMQFFMLIGLFGFIPHMSIWLTTNYGLSASAIGLFYMQGGIGSLIGNQLAGWLLQQGLRFSLIGIGSVLMGTVLMLSTQDLLPGPWMGAMFFGIMLGGSMRMPGLQTILIELTGKEIRGRLMAMSMIVSNMTMGLGGFWSTGLLSMENGYLLGMDQVGLVSMLTLLVVLPLIWLIQRQQRSRPQPTI